MSGLLRVLHAQFSTILSVQIVHFISFTYLHSKYGVFTREVCDLGQSLRDIAAKKLITLSKLVPILLTVSTSCPADINFRGVAVNDHKCRRIVFELLWLLFVCNERKWVLFMSIAASLIKSVIKTFTHT